MAKGHSTADGSPHANEQEIQPQHGDQEGGVANPHVIENFFMDGGDVREWIRA